MTNERTNEMTFAMEAAICTFDLGVQVREIVTADITEFAVLEVAPEPIHRVQFRRIARQAFKLDAPSGARGQEILDHLAAVDRGTIPDHQQLRRDMPQELTQESHDVLTGE